MNKDNLLGAGDSVEVGVTHEVLIGREKSWIKLGVVTKVNEGETGEDATLRASEHIQKETTTLIKAIVDQVNSIQNGAI
jgi:hypothetical protein